MNPKAYDIVILTDHRYVNPPVRNDYINNVLFEDQLLKEALEKVGLHVYRTNWDDPDFDWQNARSLLFRSTWDYFDRFEEFGKWLSKVNKVCRLINSNDIIYWNLDKKYLIELQEKGVLIPESLYIDRGNNTSLSKTLSSVDWQRIILKPAVSGAARHTYFIGKDELDKYESLFSSLVKEEAMILQEFQENIVTEGELSLILFGGIYSHSIRKKAKAGDFRVQDDHGGTVHLHKASDEEIRFAEKAVRSSGRHPLYARVDIMRDNKGRLCLGELELIEPELWFRFYPQAVDRFASVIRKALED